MKYALFYFGLILSFAPSGLKAERLHTFSRLLAPATIGILHGKPAAENAFPNVGYIVTYNDGKPKVRWASGVLMAGGCIITTGHTFTSKAKNFAFKLSNGKEYPIDLTQVKILEKTGGMNDIAVAKLSTQPTDGPLGGYTTEIFYSKSIPDVNLNEIKSGAKFASLAEFGIPATMVAFGLTVDFKLKKAKINQRVLEIKVLEAGPERNEAIKRLLAENNAYIAQLTAETYHPVKQVGTVSLLGTSGKFAQFHIRVHELKIILEKAKTNSFKKGIEEAEALIKEIESAKTITAVGKPSRAIYADSGGAGFVENGKGELKLFGLIEAFTPRDNLTEFTPIEPHREWISKQLKALGCL